jgi:hypothetical protein
MDPNKQSIGRIKKILSQAQSIPAGEAREEFLEQACGEDAGLRQEVESLLEAFEATRDILSHDASGEALKEASARSIAPSRPSRSGARWR